MKKYIKASFDNWIPDWLRNDKGALKALSDKGFDLKRSTFQTDPTGRGKDYPIYLVGDGRYTFVWIPGVYNDGYYTTDPYDRNYKAVKYIAKKNLPIKDTVYINKVSGENFKEKKQRYRDPRYQYDRGDPHGRYAGQYYMEPSKYSDDTEGRWSTTGLRQGFGYRPRDKSGYVIPNPQERLLDFYGSDAGMQKLLSRIQTVYEDLIDVRSRIFDVDFRSFGKDWEGKPDIGSTTYGNMLSRLGSACREYRFALRDIEKMQAAQAPYDSYRAQEAFKLVQNIERTIQELNKMLETERDW